MAEEGPPSAVDGELGFDLRLQFLFNKCQESFRSAQFRPCGAVGVKGDDKIPNIAGIKFPTYNRTIVSMRGARFLITRGEFFMIKEMYERGMSISDIARELGIDRKTVRKYIHSPNPPSKSKRKQRKSKLDPFKSFLRCSDFGVYVAKFFCLIYGFSAKRPF